MPVVPPLTDEERRSNEVRYREYAENMRVDGLYFSPLLDGHHVPARAEVLAMIEAHGFTATTASGTSYRIDATMAGKPAAWVGEDGREWVFALQRQPTIYGWQLGPRRLLLVERLRFEPDG